MPPRDPSPDDEKIDRLRRAMYSRSLSPKIKDRERRELEPERPIVGEDWREPQQEPEHMAPQGRFGAAASSVLTPERVGIARKVLWWVLGIALAFFIVSLGVFAYFYFLGGGALSASSNNISIAVAGSPEIAGGEASDLEVTVTNHNRTDLETAQLVITYPSGTRSAADFTTPLQTETIPLGTIAAGQTREGKITAVFAGTQGQQGDVKFELQYRLAGSSAIFTAPSDYAFTFSSSPISLSVDGDTETVSGQPMQMTVTISSNTDVPVEGVLLSAQFPFGFTLSSASPAPDSSGLWELGALSPGQQQTVTIQGTLSGDSGASRVFQFTAGTKSSATSTSIDTPLANNTLTMNISQPFLGLGISVNNATGTQAVVTPGEQVTVSINYQNNLSSEITDAVIVARLSGLSIDGTTVQSPNGFYRSTDNAVLWNETTTNGALSTLAPGASGTLSFTFQVPSASALQGLQNPTIDISVDGAGNRVSQTGVPENLQSTAEQNVAVASNLQISSQGLYFTDPFTAAGPMPPQAGVETDYAAVLTITNTTSEIDNAVVTATLPPYVHWLGSYEPASENVHFNNDNGTVTWNVGTIAPGAGINGAPPRQFAFSIGLTPSTSQIGSEPPLLQNITLTGTDASTGESVSETAPNITTNIVGDPGFTSANATIVAPAAATSTQSQ